MAENKQVAEMRASIGSVFYRKSAFDNMMNSKFDRMCNNITNVIDDFLDRLGQAIVDKARELIGLSEPGGGTYQIINKKGEVLDQWTASEAGQPPAIVTSLLLESIDYRVGSGGDRADFVEVGVWSNAEWEYKTIAFFGASKKHPYGRLVVDDEGGEDGSVSYVNEYAARLEDEGGLNRPFLRPAFEEVVLGKRREYQQDMKQAFAEVFGEKVPVTFRIYVGKKYQGR